MTRFVTFLVFITGLVLAMSLSNFKNVSVSHSGFDFEKQKQIHQEKIALIEKLEQQKLQADEPSEPEVIVEKPLVELSTPQLVRGSDLYKKCIACHGVRGEGKKSQNSPMIGGQYVWYLETQIANIRDGIRVNRVMNPYVRNLSDEDIMDLSVYISKLPWNKEE